MTGDDGRPALTVEEGLRVERTMSGSDEFDVAVVGGGQAGLAIGYYLAEQGRRFVILEAGESVATAWHNRWDSLVLFTSRRYDGLPGLAFTGDADGYPNRDEVIAYLDGAWWIELPVFAGDGAARHERGVTDVPGLYFLGLAWQHTRGSALLGWVKDDARFIAQQIAANGEPTETTTAGFVSAPTGERS